MSHSHQPDLSIVVPIKNEEGNIHLLADEIHTALQPTSWSWECIWMDDGSTDQSLNRIQELMKQDPRHRCLVFPQNRGQSVALWYGFRASRGRILVMLDGDRQNDPTDIPSLVALVDADETDVANGYRERRQDSWTKKMSSKIANTFRNGITGKTVRDVGCSIRAMKRECVAHLPLFTGMHRFLPTLMVYQGFRIAERPVNHRPRERGSSKYNIHNRLWVGLFDLFGVYWMKHRGFCAQWNYKELYQEDSLELSASQDATTIDSNNYQISTEVHEMEQEANPVS